MIFWHRAVVDCSDFFCALICDASEWIIVWILTRGKKVYIIYIFCLFFLWTARSVYIFASYFLHTLLTMFVHSFIRIHNLIFFKFLNTMELINQKFIQRQNIAITWILNDAYALKIPFLWETNADLKVCSLSHFNDSLKFNGWSTSGSFYYFCLLFHFQKITCKNRSFTAANLCNKLKKKKCMATLWYLAVCYCKTQMF